MGDVVLIVGEHDASVKLRVRHALHGEVELAKQVAFKHGLTRKSTTSALLLSSPQLEN